jgi:hypothetical protein
MHSSHVVSTHVLTTHVAHDVCAMPVIRWNALDCVQLLSTDKVCPLDGQPLHSSDISDYSPNFGLLNIVAALCRDVAEIYRLPAGKIIYDTDEGSFLGEGGNGRVYRGAHYPPFFSFASACYNDHEYINTAI